MGASVDLNDLVDAPEIARRFGVQRQSVVYDWRRRHPEFPEPVYVTNRIRLWLWPEVARWGQSTGRLP
ncbi:MAG: hypothetical protein ACR2MB_12940 [Acidimicrobiales bacterium]